MKILIAGSRSISEFDFSDTEEAISASAEEKSDELLIKEGEALLSSYLSEKLKDSKDFSLLFFVWAFIKKFGENGYAKFFFEDEEYEKFLKDIRELLSNKELYIETQRRYINELKVNGKI